jgi:tripartite-type tricarboxylate transporter receptor subunit TctC
MTPPRRRVLFLLSGAAAVPALTHLAGAQAYPARPVRLIVGFAAGGASDIQARLIAQWLSARLNQQFIVENRPGAGGTLASEAVARAPADGYTLLWITATSVINATLSEKPSFDFLRDIAAVAGVNRESNVMVVHPSFPARTVPEFIAYAKTNPGRISMASAGNGNVSHLAGELFKQMTGSDMVHVPYRGGAPALTDLLGGQVQVMFPSAVGVVEHIRAGRLRALAVTAAARWETLPDIPALAEFVPGYEVNNWFGVGAPKDTKPAIVEVLNKEINAGIADPRIKKRLEELGGSVLPGPPAAFGKLMAEEAEKWTNVIRAANIKAR